MVLPIILPLIAVIGVIKPAVGGVVGVGGVFGSVWIGHWKDHFPESEQDRDARLAAKEARRQEMKLPTSSAKPQQEVARNDDDDDQLTY